MGQNGTWRYDVDYTGPMLERMRITLVLDVAPASMTISPPGELRKLEAGEPLHVDFHHTSDIIDGELVSLEIGDDPSVPGAVTIQRC